ncbi:MAG: hypothetical protein ACRC41_16020 [Sarcina sp.]
MNKLLLDIFKKENIKCFYIHRGNETDECVVFNHISKPLNFSDNKFESIEYTILLNFYCRKDIELNKKKILKIMLDNGFKLNQINQTLQEDNGVFNTPFKFKKILYGE